MGHVLRTLLLATSVLAGLRASAQCIPVAGEVEIEGGGRVVSDGLHAYVNGRGEVVDVRVPDSPVWVATVPPHGALDTELAGDLYAAAMWIFGVQLVDVSAPESPSDLGLLSLPGESLGVAIEADHVYVAAGANGLYVVDVGDRSTPVLSRTIPTGFARGVDAANGFVYVVSETALTVIDVRDPAQPLVLAELDLMPDLKDDHVVEDVVTHAGHAYVLTEQQPGVGSDLLVVDVSDPANPVRVGLIGAFPVARLALDGDRGVVGNRVLDLTTPSQPVVVAELGEVPPIGGGAAMVGHYVYMAARSSSDTRVLRVYDLDATPYSEPCSSPPPAPLPTLDAVHLAADLPSPQDAGPVVHFGADIEGTATEGVRYQFLVKGARSESSDPEEGGFHWEAVKGWSDDPTFDFDTALYPGLNQVGVAARYFARPFEGTLVRDSMSFQVNTTATPVASVQLSVDPVSPQVEALPIEVTAAALGTGDPVEYRFWSRGPRAGAEWRVVQDWSPDDTWIYDYGLPGWSELAVWSRSVGSPRAVDAMDRIPFQRRIGEAESVVLHASHDFLEVQHGSFVYLNANAEGTAGSYEYEYLLKGPSTGDVWEVVRPYRQASYWTWATGNESLGSYQVGVRVRGTFSTRIRDTEDWLGYEIIEAAPGPRGGIILSVSGADSCDPQVVTFTASAEDGGDYVWAYYDYAARRTVRPYSLDPSFTWEVPQDGITAPMLIQARGVDHYGLADLERLEYVFTCSGD